MNRRFNIIFALVAVLTLLACNKEDIVSGNPDESSAISFGTVDTKAVNKASDIEEFSVWTTVSSIGSTDVSYQPLLTNERVYRNPAGSSTWTYDNTEYWITNSVFHFFAAYPYNLGFEELRQDMNGTMYTGYMMRVTANGSAETEDILTATNVINTNVEGYNTTVPLTFSHLLTKFNLTISQNTDIDSAFEYYVTKITITGLKGNGVYTVLPYGESFMTGWDMENATTVNLEKNYVDAPVCLREDYGNGRRGKPLKVWGEDGVMLIPHDIAANGVMIRIDYLYDVNPDDTDLGTAKFIEGYIPPITWQSNTSINYNISIANSSYLTFDQPTIEPWGSPQTGGTIIIK